MSDTNVPAIAEYGLPDRATLERRLRNVREFQALVRTQLIEGIDFGPAFPGSDKPGLLKPGAEKIAKLLPASDVYEITHVVRDWDRPLFAYEIKCRLISMESGMTISEGMGEANSYEAKYRWRYQDRRCPGCGKETIRRSRQDKGGGWYCWQKLGGCGAQYHAGDAAIEEQVIGRVLNEDVYDQVNTVLKMAKKRALVDAALSAGRLSDLFTQDVEDLAVGPVDNSAPVAGAGATLTRGAEETPDDVDAAQEIAAPPIADADMDPQRQAKQFIGTMAALWPGKTPAQIMGALGVSRLSQILPQWKTYQGAREQLEKLYGEKEGKGNA